MDTANYGTCVLYKQEMKNHTNPKSNVLVKEKCYLHRCGSYNKLYTYIYIYMNHQKNISCNAGVKLPPIFVAQL